VDFDVIDELLITYSAFIKYWIKRVYWTVHWLFIDFEKSCDSGETYCTISLLRLVCVWN